MTADGAALVIGGGAVGIALTRGHGDSTERPPATSTSTPPASTTTTKQHPSPAPPRTLLRRVAITTGSPVTVRLQLAGPPIPATSVRLRDGDISDGRAWFELRRARIGTRTRGASSADLQVSVRQAKNRLRVDLATAKKLDHVRVRRIDGHTVLVTVRRPPAQCRADHEQGADDVELHFEWPHQHDDPLEAAEARATRNAGAVPQRVAPRTRGT